MQQYNFLVSFFFLKMIMIVGLPGAGKTTWGINMQKENFAKRYNIIGTDTLIDKMKVLKLNIRIVTLDKSRK